MLGTRNEKAALGLVALLVGCAQQDRAPAAPPSPRLNALAQSDLEVTAESDDANAGSSASGAVDGRLDTWWGTNAVGGSIRFDLGRPNTLGAVRIAFYKGTARTASFELQVTTSATVKPDTTWTTVLTGTSSGETNEFQRFVLPQPVKARFVRLVNRGTNVGPVTAFTEVALEGQGEADGGPGHSAGWTKKRAAPMKRWESQGLAAQGRLFTFGGYRNAPGIAVNATREAYRYDLNADAWTRLADLPESVTHAGQALDDQAGVIYLAGGFVGNGYSDIDPIVTTAHVWRYDIARDTWSAAPSLPAPRAGGALVRTGRELHFFAGTIRTGDRFGGDYRTHWALNLDRPEEGWQARAPYPIAVNHLAGVALGDTLYGVGGQRSDAEAGGNTGAVYAYDAAQDAWSSVASMPRPLGHTAASTFARGGRIVVVGGVTNDPKPKNGGREVKNVIEYDPDAKVWRELRELPAGRQSPVAGLVNGLVVVTTGDGDDKSPHDDTWVSPLSQ